MSDDFDNNDFGSNDSDDYGKKPFGFFKGKYVGKSYDTNFSFGNLGKQNSDPGNGSGPNRNNGKKNGVLFWVFFVILILISVALFVLSKNSVTGWIALVICFIVIFVLKTFLSTRGCLINIILWLVFVIAIFSIYGLTLPSEKSSNQTAGVKTPAASSSTSSSGSFKNLSFSKTYNIPDNKGTYTVNITTNNNSYMLKIIVKVPKEILPAGFKWDPLKVSEMFNTLSGDSATAIRATDGLAAAWKSVGLQPDKYRTAPLGPYAPFDSVKNAYYLQDYNDSYFSASARSLDELKAIMKSGDKIEIYWFNLKEIKYDVKTSKASDGSTQVTASHLIEYGYGLHPVLASAEIPWDSIMTELGIK